jgi:hypothetical protein
LGTSFGSLQSTDVLTIIVNDIDASAIDSLTFIRSFEYTGDASRNSILLGSDKLTLGKTYNILLEIARPGITTITSNSVVSRFVKAPVAPEFTLISSDTAFYIIFNNYSSQTSSPLFPNDGFTKITSYDVYVSEVNNTTLGIRKVAINQVNDSSSNPIYSNQYLVEASGNSLANFLTNGKTYEIAVRAKNIVGTSLFSKTSTFTPNDTPNIINAVYALSNLPYQTIKSVTQITAAGEVIVIVSPPTDFDPLRTANSGIGRVTSISILEQEYDASGAKVGTTTDYSFNVTYDASDNCTNQTSDRLVFGSSNLLYEAGFTIDSSGNANNIFRFTIPENASRIGKRYKYTAFARNIYGSGPSSKETSAFTIPNLVPLNQTFTLTNRSVTGANIVNYDGSMNLSATLTSIRGSNVDPSGSLFLTINLVDPSNTLISKAPISLDNSGNFLINNLTKLGVKHNFNVQRISVDPQISNLRYFSTSEILQRTPFKNPAASSALEAYPVEPSGNFIVPVRLQDGSAGILVRAYQTPLDSFNGSIIPDGSGNKVAFYRLFRNSSLVSEVPPFPHNFQDPSAIVNFYVQAATGVNNSYYMRTFTQNGETGEIISSLDTSPNRNATSVNYLNAVTNLAVTRDLSSATLNWTTQENSLSSVSDWATRNRIIIRDASTNVEVDASNIPLNVTSYRVQNLTPGSAYIAFVIAEGLYTKRRWDSSGNTTLLYNSAIMRQNLQNVVWVSYSSPSEPTNVETYSSLTRADIYWDPPLYSNGTNMNGIGYKIYQGFGGSDASAQSALYANINSDAHVRYLVDTSAISTYDSLTNLDDKLVYRYAIKAVTKAGGMSIATSYLLQDTSAATLTSTATSPVPLVDVLGTSSISGPFIPSGDVPSPILTTTNAASTITANVVKERDATELVLILGDNDAILDPSSAVVDPSFNTSGFTMFDTKNYATANTDITGLSNLITSSVNNGNSTINPKFSFNQQAADGLGLISWRFDNVPNGIAQKITAYWSVEIGAVRKYSVASIARDTAIDAPTAVPSTSFTVSSHAINLDWTVPTNGGGANTTGYGPLLYKLEVTDPSNILTTYEGIQSNSYTLSNLINGSDYRIVVYPYFIKLDTNSQTVRNQRTAFNPDASGNALPIRPNVAPVGPTLTLNPVINNVPGNQQFLLSITTPGGTEATKHPLTKYEVHISSSGQSERLLTDITEDINNSTPQTITRTITNDGSNNLVNGKQYAVRVVSIRNYTYAQAAPVKIGYVTPFGNLVINSISKNMVNTRTYDIVINKNGGSLPNTIIGIFNDVSGNKEVQTLIQSNSEGNLPAFTSNSGEVYSFTTTPITNSSSDAMFLISAQTNNVTSTAVGFHPSGSNAFRKA